MVVKRLEVWDEPKVRAVHRGRSWRVRIVSRSGRAMNLVILSVFLPYEPIPPSTNPIPTQNIHIIWAVPVLIWRQSLLSKVPNYVWHLESKERLRIQPAQLFTFSWWVMCVFSRVWTVAWCSSCCKLFHVVSVVGWDNERADINSRRLWGARRDSVFAGGERQTLWNSPKTCCGLWWTCYERGQYLKMVHNVYEWAKRCSWRWENRATLWIGRRPSGTRRE